MRVLAHVGHAEHCTRAEALFTAVSTLAIATALFRPWRRPMNDTRSARRTRLVLPLVLASVVTLGACGGGDDTGSSGDGKARPSTPVEIKVIEPTPGQTTGPDINVRVELVGGRVVERTTGPLTPDEGHVHVLVDGKTVAMSYQDVQPVTGLAPGPHTLLAEFVAVDHNPFRNRPTASVIFTVAG